MNLDEVEALIRTVTRRVMETLDGRAPVSTATTAGRGACPCSTAGNGAACAAPAAHSSQCCGFEGHLLTVSALQSLPLNGSREIRIGKDTVVTPLARDKAAEMGLSLVRCDGAGAAARNGVRGAGGPKCVAFFSDGVRRVEESLFRSAAEAAGFQVKIQPAPGRGQDRVETAVDCVRLVGTGECCRAIVLHEEVYQVLSRARRVPGVRPRVCWEVRTAAESRRKDDANVLLLSARSLGLPPLKGILAAWLSE